MAVDTMMIPQPDSILTTQIITLPSCNGVNDGSIVITSTTGANGPYTYLWNDVNGSTGTILPNLNSGEYICTITDDNNCSEDVLFLVDTIFVVDADLTVITDYNGTDVECYGDTNANITAFVTGGTAPYQYNWTSGQTNDTIFNVGAGTYIVTVTDTNGCSDIQTIDVENPDAISFNYTVSSYNGSNISCTDSTDGFIDVLISGGNGINTSTILWNTGDTTSLINNLTSGSYQLTVSDTNGCADTLDVSLTQPNYILSNYVVDSVTCYGGSDGMAFVNPSGGTAPYLVSWSTGATNDTILGLNAVTTYFVQVSDVNNCPMALDTMMIPQPDSILTTQIITLPSCNGVNDGSIVITSTTGANGPYTYLWNDVNGSTGTILPNLNSGEYICTITDDNNCSEDVLFLVDTIFVVDADLTVITDYNGTDVECYGDTNANITAFVTGGTAPYQYNWSTGSTNDTIFNVGAGTYIVTVTDTNGCSDIQTIDVENPDAISFNYTVSSYNGSNISCTDSTDGFIDVLISGGNGINTSTILWNTGDTTSLINNLTSGSYQLTVSDTNGCADTLDVSLTQPNYILSNYVVDSVTCYGGSDGMAFVNPSGGTAPYLVSWSTGATNDTILGLNAVTTYFVQISDVNNCPMALDTMMIPQPDSILTTQIITLPSCNGVNDGSIVITSTTGANGPYTYLWNDVNGSTGTILPNLNSGEYICTITDDNNCSEDVLFLVDTIFVVDADLTVITDYNGTDVECYGDTNANITAFVTGGTAPYQYNWTSGQTNDTIFNVGAGMYTVVVTDDNGCQGFKTITVNNPDSITAIIQVSDYNGFAVSCDGLSDGTVTALVSGGNGINFNTLLWNTGDTINTLDSLSVATYSYSIEDINGCNASTQITLTSPTPMSLTLVDDTLLCFGDANGSILIDSLHNGISPFNYLWDNGLGNADAASIVSPGIYTVITDDNNCSVSSSANVLQPDSLITLLTFNTLYNGFHISCFDATDADLSASTIGGVAPYLYSLDSNYYSSITNYNNLGAGNFVVLSRRC